MANTFDTVYGVTPWADVETKEETYYVPDLLEIYRQTSLWYNIVTYGVNLRAVRTGEMVWDYVYDPEPNIAELGLRDIWLPQSYFDSKRIRVTATRYGDEMQLHKYDEYITYWRENGTPGLRNIIRNRLAPHMIQSLDILARNAFIEKSTIMFAGSASGFDNLAKTDVFDVAVTRAIHLGVDYMPDPVQNPIIGYISPSAVYTITNNDSGEFVERLKYTTQRPVNYEIGSYAGIRFAKHPSLVLWNCGEVIQQTTIDAAVSKGDGAPDPATTKVEGVYEVGQSDATHYITVASETGFEAGDIVTLHRVRPAADGVKATENGVTWNAEHNLTLEIHSTASGKLTFKKPVMVDWFSTDLGGGLYGYVTKGRPIHLGIFIKGPRAVVAGVIQPPQTYAPEPIDSTRSIWRFAWDAYIKYQQFYPERFEVYCFAGPIRKEGQVVEI